MAIPSFTTATERSRAAEAVGVLGAIRGAQLRYFAEKGTYAISNCGFDTGNCGLDIDIGPLQFFDPPTTSFSVPNWLGEIQRKLNAAFGDYGLHINEEGRIGCCGGVVGTCDRLGFFVECL